MCHGLRISIVKTNAREGGGSRARYVASQEEVLAIAVVIALVDRHDVGCRGAGCAQDDGVGRTAGCATGGVPFQTGQRDCVESKGIGDIGCAATDRGYRDHVGGVGIKAAERDEGVRFIRDCRTDKAVGSIAVSHLEAFGRAAKVGVNLPRDDCCTCSGCDMMRLNRRAVGD